MLAHAFPVEGAIAAYKVGTELLLDNLYGGSAGSGSGPGNGVSIQHTRTQFGQQLGYGAFAASDTAGKA
jgi:hypothetical protein